MTSPPTATASPQFISNIEQYVNPDMRALISDDMLANRVYCSPSIGGISQPEAWGYAGAAAACVHDEDSQLYTVNANVAVSATYVYKKGKEPELHAAIKKLLSLSFKINHRSWWFNTPSSSDPAASAESWLAVGRLHFKENLMKRMEEALSFAATEAAAIGLPPDLLRLDDIKNINDKIADAFFPGKSKENERNQYKECIDACLVKRRFFLCNEFLEELNFVRIVQPPGYALFTTLAHQVSGMSVFSCAWNMLPAGLCAGHVAKEFIVGAAVSKSRKNKSGIPALRSMTVSSVVMKATSVVAASLDAPGRTDLFKKLKMGAALVQDASAVQAVKGGAVTDIVYVDARSYAMVCGQCSSPLIEIAYFKDKDDMQNYLDAKKGYWPCCGKCAPTSHKVQAMLGETYR